MIVQASHYWSTASGGPHVTWLQAGSNQQAGARTHEEGKVNTATKTIAMRYADEDEVHNDAGTYRTNFLSAVTMVTSVGGARLMHHQPIMREIFEQRREGYIHNSLPSWGFRACQGAEGREWRGSGFRARPLFAAPCDPVAPASASATADHCWRPFELWRGLAKQKVCHNYNGPNKDRMTYHSLSSYDIWRLCNKTW